MIKKIMALALVLGAMLFFNQDTQAAGLFGLKSFTADIETTSPQGSHKSRIFHKDGKQRIETEKDKSGFTILRPDKKVVWMVMPQQGSYMEFSADNQKHDAQQKLYDPNIKTEKDFIGNETVDGHPAKKYHLTLITDGKKEKSGYLWEATDLGNFPIKHQSEDGKITSIWKNIRMDGVADSLFEIPAGYKKMDMQMPDMSELMKGRKK